MWSEQEKNKLFQKASNHLLPNIILNKKAVFFDFDGTLVNSSSYHERAFNEIFKNYELSFCYDDIKGVSTDNAVRKILDSNKLSLPEKEILRLIQSKKDIAFNLMPNMIKEIEGASNMLKYFYKLGISMSIYTAGSKNIVIESLKYLGWLNFLDYVITADDVSKTKPNPEGFNLLASLVNLDKKDCIIFEDSFNGFMAAYLAKIDYINVSDPKFMYSSIL